MIVLLPDSFDYYERPQPLYMQGCGHSVSGDEAEYDAADEVRRVAEEVTGKDFSKPRRGFGFLGEL